MRWHYRDPGLLWLWPAAFALHILEELVAGETFPVWVARVTGGTLPIAAFAGVNAMAMAAAVAGVRAAVRSERWGWAAVALATVFGINAALHLAGSAWTGSYSPGLLTGVLLYVPLALLTLLRASTQAVPGTLTRGVLAGLAVHAAVLALAVAASAPR